MTMTMIRTGEHELEPLFQLLVVDDEQPARVRLRRVEEFTRISYAHTQRLRCVLSTAFYLRVGREQADHAKPEILRGFVNYYLDK